MDFPRIEWVSQNNRFRLSVVPFFELNEISFDLDLKGSGPQLICSNMPLETAKEVRDRLDLAIRMLEAYEP